MRDALLKFTRSPKGIMSAAIARCSFAFCFPRLGIFMLDECEKGIVVGFAGIGG